MKAALSFLIALLFHIACNAEIRIEYRINKMHGLLNFVLAAADQPHTSANLKEVFLRSQFNTKENQEALKQFSELEQSYDTGFDFKESAPARSGGVQVIDIILTQSFYAKDLKDLNQRTIGLMSLSDQIQFFAILKKFEPIFDTLVWKGALPQLQKHKLKLEAVAKKVNLSKMFKSAEIFYRGNWPNELPFLIGLYPIPFLKNFRNSSSSQSLTSIEEHGVLTGIDEDANDSFGVIFHELCHSLYGSQSDEFKKEFYKYFSESQHQVALQTYGWINEALATAVGNGWAYELANKSLDRKSWYNDDTIDTLAKEIFAETKIYLTQQKPIDKEFIEKVITTYEKKYPDAIYEYDRILTRAIFTHNQTFTGNDSAERIFKKVFRKQHLRGSAPLTHKKTIESLSENSDAIIIAFSEKEISELRKLSENFPSLHSNAPTFSKMPNKSFFSILDEKLRPYIVIKVETEEQLEQAFKKMAEVKKIDPKNPVISF